MIERQCLQEIKETEERPVTHFIFVYMTLLEALDYRAKYWPERFVWRLGTSSYDRRSRFKEVECEVAASTIYADFPNKADMSTLSCLT